MTGVRFQDPLPLTLHPSRITLPGAPSTHASKKGKRKQASDALKAASATPPFLSASVACTLPKTETNSRNRDICTVTVQSGGIHVYNVVFIPSSYSLHVAVTNGDEAMDVDGNEEEVEGSSKFHAPGKVCVAVSNGPNVPVNHAGRLIWIWDVQQPRDVHVPGKPTKTVTVDSPVQSLNAYDDGNLVVVFVDGGVGILDLATSKFVGRFKATSSLKGTVVWSKMFQSEEGTKIVLITKGKEDGMKLFVETIMINEGRQLAAGIPKTALDLSSKLSPASFAFNAETHDLFILDQSGELYVFPTSLVDCNALSPRISIDLSHSKLFLRSIISSAEPESYESSCITPVGSSYVAIAASRYRGKFVEEVLIMWDIKYGTLQSEKVLNAREPEMESSDPLNITETRLLRGKIFDIIVTSCPSLGPTLALTVTDVEDLQPLSFSSSTHLVPYYCTEVTLLSALGKMQGGSFSLKTFDKESPLTIPNESTGLVSLAGTVGSDEVEGGSPESDWMDSLVDVEKSDRDTIMTMLNPNVTKTAVDFEAALLNWLKEKVAKENKQASKEKEAESSDLTGFAELPSIEITQPVMHAILSRCLLKPSAFWPSNALRYLIETGRVTSRLDPLLSRDTVLSTSPPTAPNLIRSIIEKDDLETLAMALEPGLIPDLSETDLVTVLRYVCATQEDSKSKVLDHLHRRIVAMDRLAKSSIQAKLKRSKTKDGKKLKKIHEKEWMVVPGAEEVRLGRCWFFEKIFSMPRNDVHMSRAMKVLRVEDLEVIVVWAKALVMTDCREKRFRVGEKREKEETAVDNGEGDEETIEGRKPLWWLWPEKKSKHAMRYDLALDVLSLIMDSNLSSVLLSPSLQERFEGLSEAVSVDLRMLSLLQRKLKESLVAFGSSEKAAETKASAKAGKEKRARWKRMVAGVQDGVGKYALEVLKRVGTSNTTSPRYLNMHLSATLLLACLAATAATAARLQQPLFSSVSKKPELSAFQRVLSVPSLPGYSIHVKEHDPAESLCDPNVLEITGYLETLAGYFFFFFFESRSNPSEDPFILWTNGGPGCSSGLGLFMELGPCRVNPGGNGTTNNPYSWTENASVMFIDQPVDVGFSYAKEGQTVGDSKRAGKDIDAFLQVFFYHYPKYAKNDFHAFGESYGGHYIPAIGKAIHDANVAKAEDPYRIPVKLVSIGIGNGWVDQTEQTKYFPDFACDTKYGPVADEKACQTMRDRYPMCKTLGDRCDKYLTAFSCVPASLYCGSIVSLPKEARRNPYDIRQECDGSLECYPIINDIDIFLNTPEIQEKIGVSRQYTGCSNAVGINFMKTGDSAIAHDWMVAELLDAGVRALVYAGDADYVCNWMSNIGWLKAMEWSGTEGFNNAPDYPLMSAITGKQAGEFRTYGNLTWLKVFESGHMVPYDQPEHSLEMIQSWLKSTNFRN
ncbi:hypothetical protein HDU67_001715 [Dinochytrium kinnereticum]|nr:hypothetical protein HDU67_001715 [Dinochytrium kinnereticum]